MTMLTTKELADRWGLSEQTLRIWRTEKRGPEYLKIGRNVRYDLDAVKKYEESSN